MRFCNMGPGGAAGGMSVRIVQREQNSTGENDYSLSPSEQSLDDEGADVGVNLLDRRRASR